MLPMEGVGFIPVGQLRSYPPCSTAKKKKKKKQQQKNSPEYSIPKQGHPFLYLWVVPLLVPSQISPVSRQMLNQGPSHFWEITSFEQADLWGEYSLCLRCGKEPLWSGECLREVTKIPLHPHTDKQRVIY